MQIKLTREHEDWLRTQVAAGRFSSLDEAVAEAIDSLKGEDEELEWAKPLVEEGLAQLDRGASLSAQEVFTRLEAQLRGKA